MYVPDRTDWRPVMIADRVGVHCALDGVVVEPDALAGELVDPRGRGVPAVAREVAPADVVAQDENEIRTLIGHVLPLPIASIQGPETDRLCALAHIVCTY